MKKSVKRIPIFNVLLTLYFFALGGCSNFPATFAQPTSISTIISTATDTETAADTATPTPTLTLTPTLTPSPTPPPYGGASGAIIIREEEANLSGNNNYNDYYFSIVKYNFVTKTKDILAQSDSKTTSYEASSISSNGDYLYLSKYTLVHTSKGESWNNILYQMDISSRKLTRLSSIPQFSGTDDAENLLNESWPDISSDGKFLVFNSNRDYLSASTYLDKIYVMNLNDFSIKSIPNIPQKAFRARISPDGKTIALHGWDGNDWEIYTIGIDGTNLQQITNNTASDRYPDWSPDGTKLVFHSDRDGNIELYIYDLVSRETTRITNNPAVDATANWSPDGKMLLFLSNRDGNDEIYAVNIETKEEVEIYKSAVNEEAPLWVP